MDEIKVYPIIITKDQTQNEYPYLVEIPDLDGLTEGKTVADAIEMAKDYIGTYALEDPLPNSNIRLPKVSNKDALVSLVTVNISEYKRKHDNKVVKKTITIPNYLNELGKEAGINFSELMTKALKTKLKL